MGPELARKLPYQPGLRPLGIVHIKRQAHDDGINLTLPDDPRDPAE